MLVLFRTTSDHCSYMKLYTSLHTISAVCCTRAVPCDQCLLLSDVSFGFSRLGVKSGGCAVYHKTNRETMVEIGDSVRGKDIYIIQTGTKYDTVF